MQVCWSVITNWVANCNYKIEIVEKNGWGFFDDKIRPDLIFWHQISDRKTIGKLLENGTNPKAVHNLEHVFIGSEKSLNDLSDELSQEGFQKMALEGNKLVLLKSSNLDLEGISNLTGNLAYYCESIGVKYDGWGSEIVN